MRTPKIDNEKLAELIRKAFGNVSAVAKEMGISRQAVAGRISRSKKLKAIVEESKETLVDIAESKLARAVGVGQEWAIKRVLDSKRGVQRGWRPPTQIDFEGRHDVRVNRLDEDVGREILDRLKPKPAEE